MESEEIKQEIRDHYTSDRPWSFGGISQIYRHFNGRISVRDIKDALASNKVYTSFKRRNKPKKFSPIYVFKKRELFQADTCFFTNKEMVAANDGIGYLFVVIDCFTKMAWCEPMKKNDCKTALNLFKLIIKKAGKPQRLNTDKGSELKCASFERFLVENDIFRYFTYSQRKAAIVERFNLTIQNILYRQMSENRSYNWTAFLPDALRIYRSRFHRTIRMSPQEAERTENEEKVRENLLNYFHKRGVKKNIPKYKIGDKVKLSRMRFRFARGYQQENTGEYFIITSVDNKLPGEVRYQLNDAGSEAVIGSFFENEITLYYPPDYYDINILDTRGSGKKKSYYVHYTDYPSKFDEWVSAEKLKKLK